jgi:hypothetical protein
MLKISNLKTLKVRVLLYCIILLNTDSKIFGLKLVEGVEIRSFYLSCPNCDNYNLDFGFDKYIECWKCFKYYDTDLRAEHMKQDKYISKEERKHLLQIDSYIGELNDLVILVNIDSLYSYQYFMNEDQEINYNLIVQKILLPYFKIKLRIFKESLVFSIGDIEFRVSGLSPNKYGFVSSNTFIRLNK